jgi:RND family efflux transporter MFP subunit
MSEVQIEEIAKERRYTQSIHLISPATGFVLVRDIAPELRFERGKELYRIADLSRVWILADLFGKEEEYVRPGSNAKVRSAQNPDRVFGARVSNLLPQFDPVTRTLKVRLEADNPGYALRPEMFVDVEFPTNLPPTLTIASDAVIDTGLRKTVFLDRGHGYFEPRHVETGRRFGDRVEITKGLMEGERIVLSGNFLLDSESRMKLATEGLPEDYVVDPVCGMGVDPRKAASRKSVRQGETYYFCSDTCKESFDKEPAKYIKASKPDAR